MTSPKKSYMVGFLNLPQICKGTKSFSIAMVEKNIFKMKNYAKYICTVCKKHIKLLNSLSSPGIGRCDKVILNLMYRIYIIHHTSLVTPTYSHPMYHFIYGTLLYYTVDFTHLCYAIPGMLWQYCKPFYRYANKALLTLGQKCATYYTMISEIQHRSVDLR